VGLKVAVAGKGGSGKTTVAVLLAGALSRAGGKVLLVDLDSDPNLAQALGIPAESAVPLVSRKDLVAERTGSTGEPGGMFLLNPRVSDIAGTYALSAGGGIHLLPVGTVEAAGEGCFCPQTAFVKTLVGRLVLERDENVVLDLEAGLEAFGRSAVEALDLLVVVVEPGMRSVDTARRILSLAPTAGVANVAIVANKAGPGDREALARRLSEAGMTPDAWLAHAPELARRDLAGEPILDYVDAGFEASARRLLTGRAGRKGP
jgi:CO dehydrogenase maturation factor